MVLENLICPNCQTGKASYDLDNHSVVCPYIGCLKDGSCQYYKPFEKKTEKDEINEK